MSTDAVTTYPALVAVLTACAGIAGEGEDHRTQAYPSVRVSAGWIRLAGSAS